MDLDTVKWVIEFIDKGGPLVSILGALSLFLAALVVSIRIVMANPFLLNLLGFQKVLVTLENAKNSLELIEKSNVTKSNEHHLIINKNENIVEHITRLQKIVEENHTRIHGQLSELQKLNTEYEELSSKISNDIGEIRDSMRYQSSHSQLNSETIKEIYRKISEFENRLALQVAKIDEIAKDLMPDIKSNMKDNFRELSRDLKELSRDISDVRSFTQALPSSGNTIHLR